MCIQHVFIFIFMFVFMFKLKMYKVCSMHLITVFEKRYITFTHLHSLHIWYLLLFLAPPIYIAPISWQIQKIHRRLCHFLPKGALFIFFIRLFFWQNIDRGTEREHSYISVADRGVKQVPPGYAERAPIFFRHDFL